MEFLTILLSSLFGLTSPAGTVLDVVGEQAIRDRFESVEQLQLRIDNAPTHQLLNGKVDRLRLAGRGLWLAPMEQIEEFQIRIAALEVETDAIDLDSDDFSSLDRPLQGAIRLVLTEDDLNRALQLRDASGARSAQLHQKLRDLGISIIDAPQAEQANRYRLRQPRIDFLDGNRVRFRLEIQEKDYPDTLDIVVESGLTVANGRRVRLVQPIVRVNQEDAPEQLLEALSEGLNRQLDLQALERRGILIRLLQFEITSDRLEVAAFARIDPDRQ